MRDLERELEQQFRERLAAQRELRRALSSAQAAFIDAVGKDRRFAQSVRSLKALDARTRARRLGRPPLTKETPRSSLGSILVTRVPPLDYQWTWGTQSGGGTATRSANAGTGQMSVYSTNAGNDASASTRAALGIFFRPTVSNGILRLSSNPSFNYRWWTYCSLASAHSDGYLGLYVGRYTVAGGFDGAPVNQTIWRWYDDSWWSGAGSHSGSSSGYPLFAQFNVDNAHWYALWVWCGTSASGAGWGIFSGSGAGASLNVAVPSMTWELF